MATIIEDYCDFKTAKLLKEKGFDGCCTQLYNLKKQIERGTWPQTVKHDGVYMDKNGYILCPTLQMAMKWLREVHNIFICIIPSEVGAGVMDYTYVLYKIDTENFYFEDLGIQGRAKNISEVSYEKAVEAAIQFCLRNLI